MKPRPTTRVLYPETRQRAALVRCVGDEREQTGACVRRASYAEAYAQGGLAARSVQLQIIHQHLGQMREEASESAPIGNRDGADPGAHRRASVRPPSDISRPPCT